MRILGLGDRYYVECSCRFFFKFGQLHYGLGKKVEVEVENVSVSKHVIVASIVPYR